MSAPQPGSFRQHRLDILAGDRKFFNELVERESKKSAADAVFYGAAKAAKEGLDDHDLTPRVDDDGELYFEPQQAMAASIYGREDAAATLIIQRELLHRLDSIRRALWVIIAILVFLAVR